MAGYRHQYVTPGDLRFHYLEWGDATAPPIVMLHGTTSNAHSWDLVAAALAPRYRVLAFDCRDHGESDSSSGPLHGTMLADDVAAMVDAIGLESFGLIGLSMGGRTSMTYTGMHPDRVNRLVIEDIGPEVPAASSLRVRTLIAGVPATYESLDAVVEWMRQSRPYASEEWLRYTAEHATRPMLGGARETKYRTRPQPPGQSSITTPFDMWEHIKNITCPTLVIRGSDSDILDDTIMARMVATMPNAESATVQRAGHAVHEDNPDDYIALVTRFFGMP